MDLLGQLLQGLGGGASGTGRGSGGTEAIGSILDMLGGQGGPARQPGRAAPAGSEGSGGLSDLIQGFQKQGMGDAMSSWIGTGENMPVTPDQVERGVGPERVQQMSQQSGLSMQALLPILATALPVLIDALTPKGQVPQGQGLQQNLASLRQRIG